MFSPDSKIMLGLSRICDLLLLNILFLITCLPVFTIGAATTAMYTVSFRFGTEREQGIVKSYFRSFGENFKQGTLLWLLIVLCFAAVVMGALMFYRMSGVLRLMFFVFVFAFILLQLAVGYAFPLLSQFSNTVVGTFKNAVVLSGAYLPRSILVAVVNLFPWVMLVLDTVTFLQVSSIWLLLYFAAGAYLNAVLLKKAFAPYMEKAEERE